MENAFQPFPSKMMATTVLYKFANKATGVRLMDRVNRCWIPIMIMVINPQRQHAD